jgi:pimeloyl-ACP methyl ester carboxylesterase
VIAVPAVFVHGGPETAAVWNPLLAELDRAGSPRAGLICLSPPGFGAPLPTGFGATVGAYRDWLIGALETIGELVDLVGHDRGGAHVVNVAINRPDLLRSWPATSSGCSTRTTSGMSWLGVGRPLERARPTSPSGSAQRSRRALHRSSRAA